MEFDKVITDLEFLRQESRETTQAEVDELDLLNRLKYANGTAWTHGCGLAAIQIGIPVRYAWFVWAGENFELLNPEIVETKGNSFKIEEACLSIPNRRVTLRRPYKIVYKSHGKLYKAKDLKARIIQHEIDHMNGILNIDRVKK